MVQEKYQGLLELCFLDPNVRHAVLSSNASPQEVTDELLKTFLERMSPEVFRHCARTYLRYINLSPASYERLWKAVSPFLSEDAILGVLILKNPSFPKEFKLRVPLDAIEVRDVQSIIGIHDFQSIVEVVEDSDVLRYLFTKTEKLKGRKRGNAYSSFIENVHTPLDLLLKIMRRAPLSLKQKVRRAIAGHPFTPLELFERIFPYAGQDAELRETMLQNPNLPAHMRVVLAAER